MKKMTSEQYEVWCKVWHPVRQASNWMGHALYELNKSDQTVGCSRLCAGEPFNLTHQAWASMIKLQFGYANLEINWGSTGGDTFAFDLKESVRSEFLVRWASDEADDANSDAGVEAEAQSVYGDAN